MPDPLLGLDGWPGVDCSYQFQGTRARPELTVTVSARLPWADAAAAAASEQAEQYRVIGAQLDAGVTVCLLSTLEADLAMPVSEGAQSLRRFARAAELFAGATAAATTPKLAGIATLGELLDRYSLSAEQLAAANLDRPLNSLLAAGQDLARRLGQAAPDTIPADASTLAEVAGRLRISPGRLLADNRGLALAADPTAVLPGRVTLLAEARIPYTLRPGDTLATLARRFATTARELVAANAEVAGTLLPGIRIEVPVASGSETVLTGTDTLTGDSFAAVRDRLASQRADVSPDAVADALDRLGPVLAAGPVLSCPLAVLGTSDRPVSPTQVHAEYGCPPGKFAAANATVFGLLQPGVRLDLDGVTTITTEHDTLHAVQGRLNSDGVRPELGRLVAEHAAVPLYRAGARALLPPAPVSLTASPGRALDIPVVATPLAVTLRLAAATEDGAGTAEHTDTQVPPSPDRDTFVEACLTALPDVRLAIDAHEALWAVSFGDAGIAGVRMEAAAGGVTEPQSFALRPLYPTLIDLVVASRPVTATGELGEPEVRVYHSVDVELWGRAFLAELDAYLTEPLRSRLPDAAYGALVECRRQLSDAVADGLAPLLMGEAGTQADAALRTARTALASLAGTGLTEAYAASALAQYRAVVRSPYGANGRPAARLLASLQDAGRTNLEFSTSRTELVPSDATCTFAVTAADPGVAAGVPSSPQQVFDGIEIDLAGQGRTALRFVRPLVGDYRVEELLADLPPAEIPVPLREQPAPVSASPMTTQATFAATAVPTLAEAMQWTAGLSYTHQHATQDVIRVSISRPAAARQSPTPSTALGEALACYRDATAPLGQLIGTDVEPPDGSDAGTVRGNAVASLITLVTAVTNAWRGHRIAPVAPTAASTRNRGIPSGGGNAGFTGEYRLRAVYADGSSGGQLPERLVVSRTATEGDWPAIAVAGSDQPVHLTPGPVAGNSREYTAIEPLPSNPLTVWLAWSGLRAVPTANAEVTVTVERNATLRNARPTNPEFVLSSQPVQLAVPRPALRWDEEIPLPGADLTQALRDAFAVLALGQPEHRATFEVSFAEPFGEVQFVRPALLAEAELAPVNADQLAQSMQGWLHREHSVPTGAEWHLRVTVASPRDGEPPLAVFERLVLPVAAEGGTPLRRTR